jgi:hypothetical protein
MGNEEKNTGATFQGFIDELYLGPPADEEEEEEEERPADKG